MSAQEIERNIAAVMRDIDQRRNAGLREFRRMVDELRRQVVLAIVQDARLDQGMLDSIRGTLDQIMRTYNERIQQLMTEEGRRQFTRGIRVVDEAIRGAQLTVAMPYLSETVLDQAKEFRAELVTNLTNDTRSKVTEELQLAVLGQKPESDVVKAVGKNLRDPSIFGSVWARAQVIYNTEMARMQNVATERRLTQAAERHPGMKKRWLHSHLGQWRINHALMDGVTIPAKANFELTGRDKRVYKVPGPHDAALPAGETVNCRCTVVPVMPGFETEYPRLKRQYLKDLKPVPVTPPPAAPAASPATGTATKERRKVAKEEEQQRKAAEMAKAERKAREKVEREPAKKVLGSSAARKVQEAIEELLKTADETSFDTTKDRTLGGGINPTRVRKLKDDGKVVEKKTETGSIRRSIDRQEQNPREVASYQIWKQLPTARKMILHPVVTKGAGGAVNMQFLQGFNEAWGSVDVQKDEMRASPELRKAVMDRYGTAIVWDTLMWATDRHRKNWMIDRKTGEIGLIDNGLSFGMPGKDDLRTHFHHVTRDFDDAVPPEAKRLAEEVLSAKGKIQRLLQQNGVTWKGNDEIEAWVNGMEERAKWIIKWLKDNPDKRTQDLWRAIERQYGAASW